MRPPVLVWNEAWEQELLPGVHHCLPRLYLGILKGECRELRQQVETTLKESVFAVDR